MGIEEPKMQTPEELAKIHKERTLNDAELLKGGAEYNVDNKGKASLELTDDQVIVAKDEMNVEISRENVDLKKEVENLQNENIELTEKLERIEEIMVSSKAPSERAHIIFGPTEGQGE